MYCLFNLRIAASFHLFYSHVGWPSPPRLFRFHKQNPQSNSSDNIRWKETSGIKFVGFVGLRGFIVCVRLVCFVLVGWALGVFCVVRAAFTC